MINKSDIESSEKSKPDCATNKSNKRENDKRIQYKYKRGDKVLLTKPGINPKMSTPRTGPYVVSNVNNNGTITINKSAAVTQVVNIRRVTPYFD